MNKRLFELARRRGRLEERIAMQRVTLAEYCVPLQHAAGHVDQAVATTRSALSYLRRYPLFAGLAVAAIFVAKPRRIVRWARRGWVAWRVYRGARRWLHDKKFKISF